jgi:hypothetical protein
MLCTGCIVVPDKIFYIAVFIFTLLKSYLPIYLSMDMATFYNSESDTHP